MIYFQVPLCPNINAAHCMFVVLGGSGFVDRNSRCTVRSAVIIVIMYLLTGENTNKELEIFYSFIISLIMSLDAWIIFKNNRKITLEILKKIKDPLEILKKIVSVGY